MKTIIEAAINEGMYVVADWHTGDDLATDEISYAVSSEFMGSKFRKKFEFILLQPGIVDSVIFQMKNRNFEGSDKSIFIIQKRKTIGFELINS